jgi:hypothetical protein
VLEPHARPQLIGHLLAADVVDVGEHDTGAVLVQHTDHRLTDDGRPTGDDGRLAVQSSHRSSSCWAGAGRYEGA